ncbi:MAG: YoaK family protein [Solirubrobacteraceae bacterium]
MRAVSISRLSDEDLRDVLLVCLTFGAGAVDAISFLGLGRVFTAMMSGNIVLLGLAVGRGTGPEAVRSAVSLVVFALGVFAASRLVRNSSKASVWPAGLTMTLICGAIAQAGVLAGWLGASGHPNDVFTAVLVGFSALAMGLQSGAVARLGVSGVTTTYVTGTLTGLALRTGTQWELARRALVLVALLVGAAGGALLLTYARSWAPALPLAITIVVIATAIYRLSRAQIRDGAEASRAATEGESTLW